MVFEERGKMDDLFGMLYNGLHPTKQLLTAVSCNMIDSMSRLLDDKKVDIDSKLQEQNGNTALHICSQKGFQNCMKILLEKGANPDIPNDFGLTPVAMALRNGHCACVEMLLQTGSVFSDPSFIWLSEQMDELYTWIGYSPDVLQILLVATPDFSQHGNRPTRVLYETFLRTMKSPELIKIFFLSGNRLNNDEMRCLLVDVQQVPNNELYHWLQTCTRTVPSLQHLSRLAIRKSIRPNVLYGSILLPVPSRLQQYLLLPEVRRNNTSSS